MYYNGLSHEEALESTTNGIHSELSQQPLQTQLPTDTAQIGASLEASLAVPS